MKAELSQKKINIIERDFFDNPFSSDDLEILFKDVDVAEFFSWRSPSFKIMGLSKDVLKRDDLLALMLNEPRLIRRPLILYNGILILGTDSQMMSSIKQIAD